MQTSQAEIDRRLGAVREAAQATDVDAVVVSGSEYTGFEGAVRYLSGFRILHRYAYVVVPVAGDPAVVFPKEARWVGDHGETWLEEQVFAEHPGQWIAEQAREQNWERIGVAGLDYVMAVRDYRALEDGPAVIVPFDEQFDLARAVKSAEELESVREGMRINEAGVEAVLRAYERGKTEAELMAEAERVFTAAGCYRTTMDMILGGPEGAAYPEFKFPSAERRVDADDLLLYGLEVAGPGGHWVEFSRPICAAPRGRIALDTLKAMEAYHEYYDAAKKTMKAGATAHDVHMAVSRGFHERGFQLGHVTGHSIGMTMIEHPRIGEGNETVLRENMVVSMHPHAITQDERACLYMQDTWLVTADGGVPFSDVALKIYDGSEDRL
jgi:Xaa-Pro dipeptidase